jgi:hypothetical protein
MAAEAKAPGISATIEPSEVRQMQVEFPPASKT